MCLTPSLHTDKSRLIFQRKNNVWTVPEMIIGLGNTIMNFISGLDDHKATRNGIKNKQATINRIRECVQHDLDAFDSTDMYKM